MASLDGDAPHRRWNVNSEIEAMGSVHDLVHSGGVRRWEREAAVVAVRSTRKMWLGRLEHLQRDWRERLAATAEPSRADRSEGAYLKREIARLRRALRIKPPPELVREQTRLRVRAHRQRRRG